MTTAQKTKTGASRDCSGDTRRPSMLNPLGSYRRPKECARTNMEKTHREVSALQKEMFPRQAAEPGKQIRPACVLRRIPFDGMEPTFRRRRPESNMPKNFSKSNKSFDAFSWPSPFWHISRVCGYLFTLHPLIPPQVDVNFAFVSFTGKRF